MFISILPLLLSFRTISCVPPTLSLWDPSAAAPEPPRVSNTPGSRPFWFPVLRPQPRVPARPYRPRPAGSHCPLGGPRGLPPGASSPRVPSPRPLGTRPRVSAPVPGRGRSLTDGGDEGGVEGVLREAEQEAGFADAGVADEQQFEQIIVRLRHLLAPALSDR